MLGEIFATSTDSGRIHGQTACRCEKGFIAARNQAINEDIPRSALLYFTRVGTDVQGELVEELKPSP